MKHIIELTKTREDFIYFKNKMSLIYTDDFLNILFKEINFLEKNIFIKNDQVYLLEKTHKEKINILLKHIDLYQDKFDWFDSIEDVFESSIYMEGISNDYHSELLKSIFGEYHDIMWDLYDNFLQGNSELSKENIIDIYLDMVNLDKKKLEKND
jgi:hypothetical protein